MRILSKSALVSSVLVAGATSILPIFLPLASAQQGQVQAPATSFDLSDGKVNLAFETLQDTNEVQITMTLDGEGWLAFGVNQNGIMPGSTACIGLPDDSSIESPQLYDIGDRNQASIVVASEQILTSSSLTQENGQTILTCTSPLGSTTSGYSISSTGDNKFIYAWGDTNTFGYHGGTNRGDLSVSLSTNEDGADDTGPEAEADLVVGSEVCIEGYLMDFFCIARGTLFDNPSVVTLCT